MSRTVVLDSGPVGMVSNPKRSAKNEACNQWLQALLASGARVILPEIADYEVRRELLRAGRAKGVTKLDQLAILIEYLPLTTADMRMAAELWARARQKGRPTAADRNIDADVILAAQALSLGSGVIVATSNLDHLTRFVTAELWTNIPTT